MQLGLNCAKQNGSCIKLTFQTVPTFATHYYNANICCNLHKLLLQQMLSDIYYQTKLEE